MSSPADEDVTFIDCPEDVTPEWLTRVLRAAGVLGNGVVVDMSPQPVGTGQMADSVRFSLTYDGEKGPASVVGKFAAADPTSRATGTGGNTYLREVRFYQQIQAQVDIRTPRCYHGDLDENTGLFVLLLEDLAPARQGDQMEGCTADQAEIAMRELARLHGPRWGDGAIAQLDWMGGAAAAEQTASTYQMIYEMVWPGFEAMFEGRLTDDDLALGLRLKHGFAGLSSHRGPTRTIAHGDYRLDNMLYGTAEGGYPLAVVDWQTISWGEATADASYFLGAGLLPDVRLAHERDLLRVYYDGLVAYGVEGYSWDQCWSDYRRHAFSGYVMAVVASQIVQNTERGREMFAVMAERHAAQATALESESFFRPA